jgi:hypothetical protein
MTRIASPSLYTRPLVPPSLMADINREKVASVVITSSNALSSPSIWI